MSKVIYLVAEVDSKSDSIIKSTICSFSSRKKQIMYVTELKNCFGQKSGLRRLFTKTLQIF